MALGTRRFPGAPTRIADLPTDPRGYPVPWFVSWREGTPNFPVIDAHKLGVAWNNELCWVCGGKLGAHRGWVVGPMSVIEGATPEPPSHYDCALFSVTSCPHLTTPAARYRQSDESAPDYAPQANISKSRSAATAIWLTKGRGATPFKAGRGTLFGLGEPTRLEWYVAGRRATPEEVGAAIAVALPTLKAAADAEGRTAEFERRLSWVERWMPAEAAAGEA
jgi:hypothetical protein